ncbi:MAG: alpha/beta fold hydrolase [Hamadaea sp.]|nr:alpha/beta fold hydrolase [Hamadaea sp.]
MPGSRSGPKPRGSVLYRLGIKLISYDRPGYGGSTPHPHRSVADAVRDVLTIADHLGHERFAVVGRSGGGPHALACAALRPERVTRAAALVSLAPPDAPDLDWFAGMTEGNVREFTMAARDRGMLAEHLTRRADEIRSDPDKLIEALLKEVTDPDLQVVRDYAIRRLLTDTYSVAFEQGPFGWIDDVLAIRSPWGFTVEDIDVPTRLWHGADDNFSPVSHTRWFARHIPGAELEVQPATAHFGAVEVLPKLLAWLAQPVGVPVVLAR